MARKSEKKRERRGNEVEREAWAVKKRTLRVVNFEKGASEG